MAHTYTVTVDQRRQNRLMGNYGMITGTCDLTSYNAGAYGAITEITKYFREADSVRVVCGASDTGHVFQWLNSGSVQSFKCWSLGSQVSEAASTTDCGKVTFIAIGLH